MRINSGSKRVALAGGALALAVVGTACVLSGARRPEGESGVRRQTSRLAVRVTDLPLGFEPNVGQAAKPVRFIARGNGYGLYLTGPEAVLALRRGDAAPPRSARSRKTDGGHRLLFLRTRLVGATPNPRMEGVEPQSGVSHYFLGNDRMRWRTNVPHYGRVLCQDVYPGVDLVYYGRQGELEYDFVIAPGADPERIRVQVEGAQRLQIDPKGHLLIHTAAGTVRQHRPVVYQETPGGREERAGRYVLLAANTFAFRVEGYDPTRPLVIDPVLSYSTFLGGTGRDETTDIVVDADGNAYVTGITFSGDFPVASAILGSRRGPTDAFVSKVRADGSGLVFSTYLGGSGNENIDIDGNVFGGLALDGNRNVYVAGYTTSNDFPLVRPIQIRNGGNGDGFVAKLDSSGSALVYSTYLGGRGQDAANGIAVDADGNAVVAGETDSPDFPVVNAFQRFYGGGARDAFMVRFNASGSGLINATYLGGNDDDRAAAVAVDAQGAVYVSGLTRSVNFPIANAFQPTQRGSTDAFITKFNPVAVQIDYSSFLGGSGENVGTGLAVDPTGSAFVAGFTSSKDFPTTVGAFDRTPNGGEADGFIARVNPTGDALLYATYLGGSGADVISRIAIGAASSTAFLAYVTGYTTSADFPTVAAVLTGPAGGRDAFVAKLNTSGSRLEYATYLGGSLDDIGTGIAVDPAGNAYVAGFTQSADFPVIQAMDNTYNGGGSDAFLAMLSSPPAAPFQLQARPLSPTEVRLSWTDASDNETSFEIERKTATTAFAVVGSVPANQTTFDDTGLTGDTIYTYRVRARNSIGGSPYSNAVTVSTLPNPPAAPSNLLVTPVSFRALRLDWQDNSTNEDRFKIERSPDGTAFTQVGSVPANTTTFTDLGLAPNTTYYYRVIASNAGGDSPSPVASGTTFDRPPAAPTALRVTSASQTSVSLSWRDNSTNELGFKIERSPDGVAFNLVGTTPTNVTVFTDGGLQPETLYFYRVRASNAGGDSPPSNQVSVRTLPPPPAAPSALTAAAISQTEISLRWRDNSDNEVGFKIEQATAAGPFAQIASVGANTTSYTASGLQGGTTYSFRVRAFNTGGDSPYSNTATATTKPNPPAAPSRLVVTALSKSQLRLDWQDNSDNENGFKIERAVAPGVFVQIATVGANVSTFTNGGLEADRTYTYRVRAFNSAGNSDYSNEATGTTLPFPPAAPTRLRATLVEPAISVRLEWQDNSTNEDGFAVERSTDAFADPANTLLLATVPPGVTRYVDTGLAAETVYSYRVKAVNRGGSSRYSNVVSISSPPSAPSDLAATAVSHTEIRLFWIDNSGTETGFKIERKTGTGAFAQIAITAANVTEYQDTGLRGNTTYTYRVRAFNSAGNSAYSNEASATTLPPPPAAPTNLRATVLSQSEVQLDWQDNSTDEDEFRIERATGPTGSFAEIASVGANVRTYRDTGLSAGTTYRYRVRASSAAGDSAYSNEVSVTTLPPVPPAPTGLSVTTVSSTELRLDWQDNSTTETGFKIERKTGTAAFAEIATVPADTTTYTDTGLQPNTVYDYRVRAVNAGGGSAYTNEASGLTAPAVPTNLRAVALDSRTVRVTWDSSGADGFELERRLDGETMGRVIAMPAGTDRVYLDAGLLGGRTYFYRIRAFNAGGVSAFTAEVRVTTPAP